MLALDDQLPGGGPPPLSEDEEGILNRLRSIDDDDDQEDINDLRLVPEGKTTNFDDLDRNKALRLLNQELNSSQLDDDYVGDDNY